MKKTATEKHWRNGSKKIAPEENCPPPTPPSPNSNANPKPNPDPDRGTIFLAGNFPDTGETCYLNLGYYKVLTDNKIQELPPFSKFVTEMLIFRNSRSQIFFKIGALKNFEIFTGKH